MQFSIACCLAITAVAANEVSKMKEQDNRDGVYFCGNKDGYADVYSSGYEGGYSGGYDDIYDDGYDGGYDLGYGNEYGGGYDDGYEGNYDDKYVGGYGAGYDGGYGSSYGNGYGEGYGGATSRYNSEAGQPGIRFYYIPFVHNDFFGQLSKKIQPENFGYDDDPHIIYRILPRPLVQRGINYASSGQSSQQGIGFVEQGESVRDDDGPQAIDGFLPTQPAQHGKNYASSIQTSQQGIDIVDHPTEQGETVGDDDNYYDGDIDREINFDGHARRKFSHPSPPVIRDIE